MWGLAFQVLIFPSSLNQRHLNRNNPFPNRRNRKYRRLDRRNHICLRPIRIRSPIQCQRRTIPAGRYSCAAAFVAARLRGILVMRGRFLMCVVWHGFLLEFGSLHPKFGF
jgi:hypothetical protein